MVSLRSISTLTPDTFFCALKLPRSFFIGRKKPSHTAGTLCKIRYAAFA
jgi:hypothetical protein